MPTNTNRISVHFLRSNVYPRVISGRRPHRRLVLEVVRTQFKTIFAGKAGAIQNLRTGTPFAQAKDTAPARNVSAYSTEQPAVTPAIWIEPAKETNP